MPFSGYEDSYNTSSATTFCPSPYNTTKRLKTRQYYRVAPVSQVDESLFGNRKTKRQDDNINNNNNNKNNIIDNNNLNVNNFTLKRGVTTLVTNNRLNNNNNYPHVDRSYSADNQRLKTDQASKPLIISRRDFERLMQAATSEPYEKRSKEDQERWRQEQQAAVEARKERMRETVAVRRRELSDLELEDKVKSDAIRSRALEKMAEEEDEIKKMNEWIAGTKCQVIREAQVMEKLDMKRELEREQTRMERVMEEERLKLIKEEEEMERRKKEDQMVGALQIMQQIQRNEQERLTELEEKEQEGVLMQKYLNNLCVEEVQEIEKRRKEKTMMGQELKKGSDDLLARKKRQKEEEKIVEQEVIAFQRAKEEFEASRAKEQEVARQAREKEYARLRTMQERGRDEQAERDELRARRVLEQSERQWRLKETAVAAANAAAEADLIASREQQRRQKQQNLAVQAQRDKIDFERIIRHQQMEIDRIGKEEEALKRTRQEFRKEIRQQIKEKEQKKVVERGKLLEEDRKREEEEKKRRMRVQQMKEKKVQELREAGIDERYLGQIERKVMEGSARVAYQHKPLLL